MSSYEDACRRAATDQGLDPITAALTEAGIAHEVEQTGGFTMVVSVPLPAGERIDIADGFQWNGQPGWFACFYTADPDDEGTILCENGALIDVQDAIAFAKDRHQ